MDIKTYIESGILELFVAGKLDERLNKEVVQMMNDHPEVRIEIQRIEAAIVKLTASLAPKTPKHSFDSFDLSIDDKIKPLRKPGFGRYMGWAAAFLMGTGLLWMTVENGRLDETIAQAENEKTQLEEQLVMSESNLENRDDLLSVLRSRDVKGVSLEGQAYSPESYAKAYWDDTSDRLVLDVEGLPEPPDGMVYQVWSLTFDPLTPTSLGTLDDFSDESSKIFALSNPNQSQAFGITLEPAGGSESPTLEQLITLGKV